MFRWDNSSRERAIDLACIDELTIAEVAEEIGASIPSVKKFYGENRAEIEAARQSIQVSNADFYKILDFSDDGMSQDGVAGMLGIGAEVVRRILLISEFDEREQETGAGLELAALREAHPGRLYEDDVEALTEYSGWKRPAFMVADDTGLRQAA